MDGSLAVERRCSLVADRADIAGSTDWWPTAQNQPSRCLECHLLFATNRLPMAFASSRVSIVEHGLPLLSVLEERWCLDLSPALNVPASTTASRPSHLSLRRHHGWSVGKDHLTWRHYRLCCAQACY